MGPVKPVKPFTLPVTDCHWTERVPRPPGRVIVPVHVPAAGADPPPLGATGLLTFLLAVSIAINRPKLSKSSAEMPLPPITPSSVYAPVTTLNRTRWLPSGKSDTDA